MKETDFRAIGNEIAKFHGWRFVGHFYPANADVVMLNFERPDGARALIDMNGYEVISRTRKQIRDHLFTEALRLLPSKQPLVTTDN